MKTQMHATQDTTPLRVEAVKIERSEGGAFISLSIRQAGDSIVDGINILMRDTAALRVLVENLDAACAAIEEEEDRERGLALKAAIHAALDRRVAERAETWRAPMRALLGDQPGYVPVPASQADLEAAGLPGPSGATGLATGGE